MKIKRTIALLAGLFALNGAVLAAEGVDPNALQLKKEVFEQRLAQLANEPIDLSLLEPCMNGQVSVSGLYATQAEEDTALVEGKRLQQAMDRKVSVSGR